MIYTALAQTTKRQATKKTERPSRMEEVLMSLRRSLVSSSLTQMETLECFDVLGLHERVAFSISTKSAQTVDIQCQLY
jgi:hypothetical protein